MDTKQVRSSTKALNVKVTHTHIVCLVGRVTIERERERVGSIVTHTHTLWMQENKNKNNNNNNILSLSLSLYETTILSFSSERDMLHRIPLQDD